MRPLDPTRVRSSEAEVNTTGEKGKEIEDHHGSELVEDNKKNMKTKKKKLNMYNRPEIKMTKIIMMIKSNRRLSQLRIG